MRIVTVFVLLCGLLGSGDSTTARGQESRQIGLTIGVNWATLDSSDPDVGTRSTYAVGVLLRQRVVGPLSLQSEMLLSQKGAEVDAEDGGSLQYGAGYLNVPVLVHVVAPSIEGIALQAEAGGFGAVKLFERQRSGTGNLSIPFGAGTTFYRRFDAGLVGGVGVSVALGERRLNVTLRHERGLVDVARSVEDQPFPTAPFPSDGRTRTWSLMARLGL